jgi:ParB-like nuclease family protein
MHFKVTVDAEFQSLIARLTPQEFESLKQQILSQGCLEPLYVWKTEADQRILLDGHNRHKICTENDIPFQMVEVRITSREEATLWILEHQAGRRNLTDDQRAIIWDNIREQRSRVERIKRAAKGGDAKAGNVAAASGSNEPRSKEPTRAAVAREAKLPERKLRTAQALKKHEPELSQKVLSGDLTLRDAAKRLTRNKTEVQKDREYFRHIGRTLGGLFQGALKEKLDELVLLKEHDVTPAMKEGLENIISTLMGVSKNADDYATKLNAILAAPENGGLNEGTTRN